MFIINIFGFYQNKIHDRVLIFVSKDLVMQI